MKSRFSQILISIFVLIGTALFINSGSNERKKVFDLETLESTILIEEASSDSDFEISFSGFGGITLKEHLSKLFCEGTSKPAGKISLSLAETSKLYILFQQLRIYS
ncbi:hypothetical protein [Owenweeksia hongkongensis]|uniref:hypothetical protein n=1 Tax=Owenweeksia hongkongensis TaxID=253245 RepID=UPI003A909A40